MPGPNAEINSTVRPGSNLFVEPEQEEWVGQNEDSIAFEHDLVDVGLRRQFLVPGDLVELTYVEHPGQNRVYAYLL